MNFISKQNLHIAAFVLFGSLAVVLAGCSSSSSTPAPALGTQTFDITLSSDNTVPQVTATGTGSGTLTLNRDSGALTGSVTVSGLSGAITVAHIHEGIAGIAGGIIVDLEVDATNSNQVNVPAGVVLSAAQMTAMRASEYYINVHTSANPSGEVRGQIVGANEQVIRVVLSGQSEVPPVTTTNSGVGYLTVNTTTGALRGNIRNTGLDDAVAAHIHSGFAGVNGGVQIDLQQDSGTAALWTVPAATVLDTAALDNFLAGGNYFNAHTPANPSGELRGQIIADGIALARVDLSGTFEVPPVTSAGSAVGYVTVNESTLAVTAHINFEGLADTVAAHIHTGVAGTNGGVLIDLTKDATEDRYSSASGAAYADSAALADFAAGRHYFNLHTTTNPSGELRGQIAPENITVTRNELDGSQEVPPVMTAATGIGYTTVNESSGAIIANVTTSGVVANAAHVHIAPAGSNGGIAVGLTQDSTNTDFWSAEGTLDATQLDAFLADGLYFNVHSAANPGGEIRAQITR